MNESDKEARAVLQQLDPAQMVAVTMLAVAVNELRVIKFALLGLTALISVLCWRIA